MATSTGKKARKAGGTKVACKRAKARTRKHRTFGTVAKGPEAVLANERFTERVWNARRARGMPEDGNDFVSLT